MTALRWAGLWRSLGHRVAIAESYDGRPCDVLVALHARRSADSVERYHRERPEAPLVLALTGTDLYRDLHDAPDARRSLDLATRLVVLQPLAVRELPEASRAKARVIYQSARRPPGEHRPDAAVFEVCVIGHLRDVKDPFRAALAARLLPASSRIRIVHVGAALDETMAARARAEEAANARYRWLGRRTRGETLETLARARLLVLSSVMEGGANVISEAIACGVPVLSSRIPGSLGILGEDYPGYFPVGDTAALSVLLLRAETDEAFGSELRRRCDALAPLVDPARERRSWRDLLGELAAGAAGVAFPGA